MSSSTFQQICELNFFHICLPWTLFLVRRFHETGTSFLRSNYYDWRQVFGAKFCLEKNWKQDKFEVRSIGPGGSRISHVVNETDTLHSAKTLLLYADKNHKIRISDPYGGQEFKKLTGHRYIHIRLPVFLVSFGPQL
eukprot:TRINITY_DN660_c0_g1_i18.p1 TRINITY_DN660_c0_g1~~TRINITY_DN660_c0_g1_i18.p1  ORF type:complete len:137 (+),score=7.04 TRINITY_DN660_c0_g1_i18:22-432(+)